MTTLIRGHRRLSAVTAVTLPLLAAAAAAALIAAPDLHAADPFVAGGRSTRPVVTRPDENRRAEARGHSVAVALGLRPTGEVAERLDDRFDHRTYDEVTSFDAGGRAIAVTRLGLDGGVQMTTILGWHGSTAPAIDAASATRVARAAATRLGLVATGRADVRASAGAGGWSVTWPRIVDGALVRGDGLRVLVFSDGTVHGLVVNARPLAERPPKLMEASTARTAALAVIAKPGSNPAELRVVAAELVWVAPNERPDGSTLDAPGAELRLAWAVRFEPTARAAPGLRAREVWLDAGDATLLGGDAVE